MTRDKERARRTELPQHMDEEQEERQAQPQDDYPFTLEAYTIDCFVDVDIMLATNSCMARGVFIHDEGREVQMSNNVNVLHVPAPPVKKRWMDFVVSILF